MSQYLIEQELKKLSGDINYDIIDRNCIIVYTKYINIQINLYDRSRIICSIQYKHTGYVNTKLINYNNLSNSIIKWTSVVN